MPPEQAALTGSRRTSKPRSAEARRVKDSSSVTVVKDFDRLGKPPSGHLLVSATRFPTPRRKLPEKSLSGTKVSTFPLVLSLFSLSNFLTF